MDDQKGGDPMPTVSSGHVHPGVWADGLLQMWDMSTGQDGNSS